MTIEIKGMEAVVKKLESLNKPAIFKAPMRKSLDHLEGKVKRDPTKAAGAFSSMATEGQRKAYWAKVSENPSIHGPRGYIRSHRLYNAWQKKITSGGRIGTVFVDENAVPYAKYVEGTRQQPFHRASNWPRVDKVAKEEAKTIIRFFQQAYEKALK